MRKVLLLSVVGLGVLSLYGCTGDMNVGPWLGEGGAGERGPGATATTGGGMGGEGASGPASTTGGGMGGTPIDDCTNPDVEAALTKEVQDKLYLAQLCDPSLDELKCDLYVEGMCCEEVVDPGYMDMNMPKVQDYLDALQKWKDKGCKCPVDPPNCPPHEPFGMCDPTGFPSENQGLCKKI